MASAAPSVQYVSGTISDDETVTISGSNFGTKSPAAPVGFYDFEDNTVPAGWTYEYGSAQSDNISISTQNYSGTYSAEFDIYTAMRPSFSWISGASSSYNLYIFQKLMRNWSFTNEADNTRYSKIKFCRYVTVSGQAYPNFYYEFSLDNEKEIIEYSLAGDPYTDYFSFDIENVWAKDSWGTFEVYYGVAQSGEMRLVFDGNIINTNSGLDFRSDIDSNLRPGFGFYQPMASERSGGVSAPDRYWADDIYIDNTQARVFISENSNGGGNREIQIPSTWSSTSITITFNQGTFSTSDTVYLFVCDSYNACSSAYTLTIGGSEPVLSTTDLEVGGVSVEGITIPVP